MSALFYNADEIRDIKLNAYEELEIYRHSDECRQKKIELMMEELCNQVTNTCNISSSSDYNTSAGFNSGFAAGLDPIDAYAEIGMREAAMLLYQPWNEESNSSSNKNND